MCPGVLRPKGDAKTVDPLLLKTALKTAVALQASSFVREPVSQPFRIANLHFRAPRFLPTSSSKVPDARL